jgi:hypothetical protein
MRSCNESAESAAVPGPVNRISVQSCPAYPAHSEPIFFA